jgi:hypothetical protein
VGKTKSISNKSANTIVNTDFYARTLERTVANLKPTERQPYSQLTDHFFARVGNEFGQLLPVYALGHTDPEIRRLANELFERLWINREGK